MFSWIPIVLAIVVLLLIYRYVRGVLSTVKLDWLLNDENPANRRSLERFAAVLITLQAFGPVLWIFISLAGAFTGIASGSSFAPR